MCWTRTRARWRLHALDPGVMTTYRIETRRSDLDFDRVLVQAQGVLGR